MVRKSMHLAWSNESLSYIDSYGLAVGKKYESIDAAGTAAVAEINPTSIASDAEYAGVVYRNDDGSYSYTAPNKGTQDGSDNGSAPWFTQQEATYHTHGGEDPGYDNENFSQADINQINEIGQPGYLGTPSGAIKRLDPGGETETLVKGNPDKGKRPCQ